MDKKVAFFVFFSFVVAAVSFAVAYFFIFRAPQGELRKTFVEIKDQLFQVEVADSAGAKSRGLSGREKLEEREGMIFQFAISGKYPFWMKDMKFPIDIVWIKEGKIVGFSEDAKPQPDAGMVSLTMYFPPEAVDMVFEVNSGIVKKYGFAVGDEVRFVDRE